MIVKPDIFVSTKNAFSHIRPHRRDISVRDAVQRPIKEWKKILINDFEESVFPQFPAIGEIKDKLYEMNAVYASMSGSGSSVFGIFEQGQSIPDMNWGEKSFCFKGKL